MVEVAGLEAALAAVFDHLETSWRTDSSGTIAPPTFSGRFRRSVFGFIDDQVGLLMRRVGIAQKCCCWRR